MLSLLLTTRVFFKGFYDFCKKAALLNDFDAFVLSTAAEISPVQLTAAAAAHLELITGPTRI